MTLKILIFSFPFLQFFSWVQAQSPQTQEPIKVRMVCLGLQGQIRDVGLWKEGKFEELRIPSSYFPEAVDYVGPNPITLVSKVVNEEGEEVPTAVGRVMVPENATEVLLLMYPLPSTDKNNPSPTHYKLKVIDFSALVFPEDSFLLWNLTGRTLLGTVDKKPFRSTPKEFVLITPDLQGESRALDAKMLYADDPDQKSYTSRKWFINPGQKYLAILTENPKDPDAYLVKMIRH
ncbi:hypothetical protein P0Y35_02820 [Kiritimatiellaeota bacterium B1221]|nr:hypothetical protein [Kiritimatiellaeota bacterium B1221]